MSNNKLAEALRDSIFVAAMLDAICEIDGTVDRMKARDAARRVREALLTHLLLHAAEAAQAQAQSDEWVMVPREPTEAMVEAAHNSDECPDGPSSTPDFKAAYVAMLAAATQQAAEDRACADSRAADQ